MKKMVNKANTPELQGRRKLLKVAMIGGAATAALPEKWTRPVVDSVMLPVHAETTPISIVGYKFFLRQNENVIPDVELAAMNDPSLMDMLVPTAYATDDLFPSTTEYCVQALSETTAKCYISRTFDGTGHNYFAQGELKLNQLVKLDSVLNCETRIYRKDVTLDSLSPTEAVITTSINIPDIDFQYSYTRTLPVNAGASAPTCGGSPA